MFVAEEGMRYAWGKRTVNHFYDHHRLEYTAVIYGDASGDGCKSSRLTEVPALWI